MRRTARLLTGTALAVAAAGLGTAPAHAGVPHLRPAQAGSLQVYPSTALPGSQVTVNTAACGEKGAALGDAGAVGAGTFALAPTTHEGEAIGRFQVPAGRSLGCTRSSRGARRATGG